MTFWRSLGTARTIYRYWPPSWQAHPNHCELPQNRAEGGTGSPLCLDRTPHEDHSSTPCTNENHNALDRAAPRRENQDLCSRCITTGAAYRRFLRQGVRFSRNEKFVGGLIGNHAARPGTILSGLRATNKSKIRRIALSGASPSCLVEGFTMVRKLLSTPFEEYADRRRSSVGRN